MKLFLSFLLILISAPCFSGVLPGGGIYVLEPTPHVDVYEANKAAMEARGKAPANPWRTIDGKLECIRGPGWASYYVTTDPSAWERYGKKPILADEWARFSGRVIEVQPLGVRVRSGDALLGEAETVIFVRNYPYQVAEGDFVSGVAKEAGLYTYNTVSGGSATLHQVDYGTISDPPPQPVISEEEIKSQKATAQANKAKLLANALKANMEAAAAGEVYGELRMGQRYRDGDGVAKDPQKAREWFSKAAAQGDKTAKQELSSLP